MYASANNPVIPGCGYDYNPQAANCNQGSTHNAPGSYNMCSGKLPECQRESRKLPALHIVHNMLFSRWRLLSSVTLGRLPSHWCCQHTICASTGSARAAAASWQATQYVRQTFGLLFMGGLGFDCCMRQLSLQAQAAKHDQVQLTAL